MNVGKNILKKVMIRLNGLFESRLRSASIMLRITHSVNYYSTCHRYSHKTCGSVKVQRYHVVVHVKVTSLKETVVVN